MVVKVLTLSRTHLALVVWAAALLAACGTGDNLKSSGANHAAAATAADPVPGAGGTTSAPKGALTCADGEKAFALAPSSKVQWVVVKGGGIPVIGTHVVAGSVRLHDSAPLGAAQMELGFGLEGALTDHSLRDDRLRKVIFKATDGDKLGFHLTNVATADGQPVAKLPDPGMSVQVVLSGTLSLAGVSIPVSVPVLLMTTATGLRVTEGLDGISLDMRDQLGIGTALDALLALVPGVTVGNALKLRMSLDLTDACAHGT